MKIQIGKYVIKEDPYCFLVWDSELDKGGKTKPGCLFPGTLSQAIRLVRKKIRADKTGSVSLENLAKKIEDMDKEFIKELELTLKNNGNNA